MQIVSCPIHADYGYKDGELGIVYGLGDDGLLYVWNRKFNGWELDHLITKEI